MKTDIFLRKTEGMGIPPHDIDGSTAPETGKTIIPGSNLCWTCGTCDAECPINMATDRLKPRKIIRLAALELYDLLWDLPDIWYCIQCRRCNHVCSEKVAPADAIGNIRKEAARRKSIHTSILKQYDGMHRKLQRVRYRMAMNIMMGLEPAISKTRWRQWMNTPITSLTCEINSKELFHGSQKFKITADAAKVGLCLTCYECRNICPIYCESRVFDPVWIFRMVNLGLVEELLRSPAIWLCLQCRRCTEMCSQGISAHLLIQQLQQLAIDEKVVGSNFPDVWRAAQKALYAHFIDDIRALFTSPKIPGHNNHMATRSVLKYYKRQNGS